MLFIHYLQCILYLKLSPLNYKYNTTFSWFIIDYILLPIRFFLLLQNEIVIKKHFLFIFFQPAMPAVYAIHLVQQFADSCSDGIGLCNEFLIIAYVLVKVIEEFLGDVNTHFWHGFTLYNLPMEN